MNGLPPAPSRETSPASCQIATACRTQTYLVHHVQTLSLEGQNRRNARTELDAIAWAIDDAKKAEPDETPVSVATIGDGTLLPVAER